MMNKDSIGRGVVYLYIEAITLFLSGYIYWLILSKFLDPASIGLASTIIAFALIMHSVAFVGVSGGIQRFIAKGLAENELERVQGMINSSLLLTTMGVLITCIVILLFRDPIGSHFDIGFDSIFLSIVLIVFMVFADLFRAIIIPSLKVKVITITSVVSTLVKFSFTLALVFLDYGVQSIIIGFLTYFISSTLIYAFAIKSKNYKIVPNFRLFIATKEILVASFSFWIPYLITIIGSQLGTIFVFLVVGSANAGIFFISYSIVNGIVVMTTVLSSIAFPTISTIKDGKKRATWRLIKVSLLVTIPISNILIFFPEDILSLFGSGYATGSLSLQILSLTSLPTCISTGIGVLLYSYGYNRKFFLQGLATSIPRVMLYLLFIPIFGENGAAFGYMIGSIAGAIVSLLYAKNIKIKIFYKQIFNIFLVPIIVAIPLKLIDINFVFSIIVILISSYVVFISIKLIDSQDTEDILKMLPNSMEGIITKILQRNLRGKKEK